MTGSATGKDSCCTPLADRSGQAPVAQDVGSAKAVPNARISVPGGVGLIGTANPIIQDDGESPLRKSRIDPFLMGPTTVTRAQFAQFVDETGYITEAEHYGWSFVFWSDLPDTVGDTEGVYNVEWWRKVDGANWRDVYGPGSGADPDHPVTQVSWNDANAYATWVGGRLPSEAEWEHAARGGLGDVPFPWGDTQPTDNGPFPCNIWQGQFPDIDTGVDGFKGTAPAQSYQPNGYGLYNMVGNVWEWTAQPFRVKSLKKNVRRKMETMRGFKLLKGGSALCHQSYCFRYRIAARTGNSPDSTTTHQGFRVVWDI